MLKKLFLILLIGIMLFGVGCTDDNHSTNNSNGDSNDKIGESVIEEPDWENSTGNDEESSSDKQGEDSIIWTDFF